jgi:serine/threonine protein kinase
MWNVHGHIKAKLYTEGFQRKGSTLQSPVAHGSPPPPSLPFFLVRTTMDAGYSSCCESESDDDGSFADSLEDVAAELVVNEERVLGVGAHGAVFEGNLRGHRVAVKRFKQGFAHAKRQFNNEVQIMKAFQAAPEILSLLGVHRERLDIVVPYKSNGNLQSFLQNHGSTLSFAKKLDLAIDIVKAVHLLHENNFCHGDLSSLNVLVDEQMKGCLCDFSLIKRPEWYISFGNMLYAPPEFYLNLPYSKSCDIFSLGMILHEILFSNSPHRTQPSSFMSAKKKISLDYPTANTMSIVDLYSFLNASCESLRNIVAQCLNMNSLARPSSSTLLAALEDVRNHL